MDKAAYISEVTLTGEINRSGLNRISCADSEHFKTPKAFPRTPERMLHYLLN